MTDLDFILIGPSFTIILMRNQVSTGHRWVNGFECTRRSDAWGSTGFRCTHPEMRFQLSQVDPLSRNRYVVELSLLLRQQLIPPINRFLDQFRYSERERAHEVIPRRPVPVPNLDQQSSVFVLRSEIAGKSFAEQSFWIPE